MSRVSISTRDAFTHTVLAKIANIALGLLNSIVLVRALGPEGKGRLATFLAASFLCEFINPLYGSNVILVAKNSMLLRTFFHHSLIASFFSVLLLLCGYLLFFLKVPLAFFLNMNGFFVFLFLLLVFLQNLSANLYAMLWGLQDFRTINYVSVFAVGILLVQNLFWCFLSNFDVSKALFGLILASAISCIAFYCKLRCCDEWKRSGKFFSPGLFREGLQISFRAIASNFPLSLIRRFDVFILRSFQGAAAVGIYSVGIATAEISGFFSGILNSVMFAKSAAEDCERSAIFSAKIGFFVSLIFGFLLLIFGGPLFALIYGEEFSASAIPCALAMIGISVLNSASPLIGFIQGRGAFPVKYAVFAIGGVIINIALNFLLVPVMGVKGAAIALSLSYLFVGGAAMRMFRLELRKNRSGQ